ncbi:hypothetical protein BaRGS_00019809, partial [Batillaria attramentaria]
MVQLELETILSAWTSCTQEVRCDFRVQFARDFHRHLCSRSRHNFAAKVRDGENGSSSVCGVCPDVDSSITCRGTL